MFHNREDAAMQLTAVLKNWDLIDPLVLAIPRGGVVTGAVLARELGADLDVVVAHKLRAPATRTGPRCRRRRRQRLPGPGIRSPPAGFGRIPGKRASLPDRRNRPPGSVVPRQPSAGRVKGRSVIVTDDGIATGATMIAALKAVRAKGPRS